MYSFYLVRVNRIEDNLGRSGGLPKNRESAQLGNLAVGRVDAEGIVPVLQDAARGNLFVGQIGQDERFQTGIEAPLDKHAMFVVLAGRNAAQHVACSPCFRCFQNVAKPRQLLLGCGECRRRNEIAFQKRANQNSPI